MKGGTESALLTFALRIACAAAFWTPALSTAYAADCPITKPTIATPPARDPDAPGYYDPLPTSAYFVSADREIWAWDWGPTYLEGHRKFFWLKPQAILQVSGRRLDGDSPPLGFDSSLSKIPWLSYASSYVVFPTTGCWEITAKSGDSVLRFVMHITDISPYAPPDRGAGATKSSEKP